MGQKSLVVVERYLLQEFKLEYPPFRQRVLQITNEIRRQGGLPPITR
jgi:hypothetical protein